MFLSCLVNLQGSVDLILVQISGVTCPLGPSSHFLVSSVLVRHPPFSPLPSSCLTHSNVFVYRTLTDTPRHGMVFIPATLSTSGRIHGELPTPHTKIRGYITHTFYILITHRQAVPYIKATRQKESESILSECCGLYFDRHTEPPLGE